MLKKKKKYLPESPQSVCLGPNCLTDNLLTAKLNEHGFDNKAGRFGYDYLASRKQRTKTSDTYSSWQEILLGVYPKVQYLDHYYATLTYALCFPL